MRKHPRFASFIAAPCLALGALIASLSAAAAAGAATIHHRAVQHRAVQHHLQRHRHQAPMTSRRAADRLRRARSRSLGSATEASGVTAPFFIRSPFTLSLLTRPHAAAPYSAAPYSAVVAHLAATPTPLGGAWLRLRLCESADDYRADTGNGYYGAYQFSLETWHSIGEAGEPDTAPAAVQDAAAVRLQSRAGWHSWPSCSVTLGLV